MPIDRSENQTSILVVDDTPANLKLLSDALRRGGHAIRVAPSGEMALGAVEKDPPDLVLLDINMPGMSGYEVCRHLKSDERFREIPVIFISALNETFDKVKAFEAGGVDYVTKPFQFEEVEARVRAHLTLRRTQLELEESYRKLRELEELRDDLVHMVVHDMRSPLAVLLGNLSLLKEDLAGQISSQSMEDIRSVLSAGEGLNNMANDLLDVSRLEEGRMPVNRAECALAEVVRIAVDNVKGMQSGRDIHMDAPESIRIACDESLIQRVVANLVSNGLKHTSPERPLRVTVTAQVEGARIAVQDEGDGIPEGFKEKVFEKFGTLKARKDKKYHSAGLGLAFCKLAVEAHGGRIGIDSKEGKGSTFWFTLPRDGAKES